jgi:hypothetical protein
MMSELASEVILTGSLAAALATFIMTLKMQRIAD